MLTYGVLQRLRAEGRPLPAATLIISGWFDMALTGASYETNRDKDPAFAKEAVDWLVTNFIGDRDRLDPEVSALYADLSGFPPVFLQAGADETLVDESRMFAERARLGWRRDAARRLRRHAALLPDDGRPRAGGR